jgi:phenylalanyl-tRNA synthetase beta chain
VGTRNVVVGRVLNVRPHPAGAHIWLAYLDIGTDSQPQIVWGGVPVVKAGCLVPVALPGARLPSMGHEQRSYKIRRRRYRGEISEGMLCSLAELGWDLSATDRVALLDGTVGLRTGDSLDDVGDTWPLILKPVLEPADKIRAEEILVAIESPKEAVCVP